MPATLATATPAPTADPSTAPTLASAGRLRRRIRLPHLTRLGHSALAWTVAGALFTLYALLAMRDQQRMLTSGFDLGIFDETVRAYAHGQVPIVALKGPDFNELGDHFSPIWALLAPAYRIFPTAYTLLLAQAALLALGAVPLVRWAAHDLGHGAGLVVGTGYGLSWGIASAAGFDVHEVAFAVPMLAFSATALGRRRWGVAAAWGLPLLLVKEDLGITLAVIGAYIAWHGARRLGLATLAAGLLGTLLEVKVLIPAASPSGRYTYSSGMAGAFRGGIPGLPDDVLRLITPETKVVTVALMLAVTGFLALRSPLTLLVLPTLAWRFLSSDQAYWGTAYQYSAVLMPIVFAGFIDALIRVRASGHPQGNAIARTALATSLAFTAVLLPGCPLWTLTHAATWHTDPRTAGARQIIAEIPANATVAAGNQLAPQITDRDTVSLLDPHTPATRPAWVLTDTDDPDGFPLAPGQQAEIINELRRDGYRTAASLDGYLLLSR